MLGRLWTRFSDWINWHPDDTNWWEWPGPDDGGW